MTRREAAITNFKKGYNCSLVNVRFVKPFDREAIRELSAYSKLIVTMEENVITGGFGQQVQAYLDDNGYNGQVLKIAVPDEFVRHGSVDELEIVNKLDSKSIAEDILRENKIQIKKIKLNKMKVVV